MYALFICLHLFLHRLEQPQVVVTAMARTIKVKLCFAMSILFDSSPFPFVVYILVKIMFICKATTRALTLSYFFSVVVVVVAKLSK